MGLHIIFNPRLIHTQWVYTPPALSGVVSSTARARESRSLALQSVSSSAISASDKCMTMA